MRYCSICDQQIAYLSGVNVTYDSIQEWVLITQGYNEIFLQDWQASEFIQEVKRLENKYDSETENHAILAAYPYCDMLAYH
tara:strand:+ start:420 stop:662 length:243 start_codon:yes stop_codon:yes gene_type:complete